MQIILRPPFFSVIAIYERSGGEYEWGPAGIKNLAGELDPLPVLCYHGVGDNDGYRKRIAETKKKPVEIF
jgi:hypothetical protein